MLGPVLYALLAIDLALFAHGERRRVRGEVFAVVLAVVAIFPLVRSRTRP